LRGSRAAADAPWRVVAQGKIRVYARSRPMLDFESERGQRDALVIPDALSVEHMWKDKKREYAFDAVFGAASTQEQVRPGGRALPAGGLWLTMTAGKPLTAVGDWSLGPLPLTMTAGKPLTAVSDWSLAPLPPRGSSRVARCC
jgi:hypothetical protein